LRVTSFARATSEPCTTASTGRNVSNGSTSYQNTKSVPSRSKPSTIHMPWSEDTSWVRMRFPRSVMSLMCRVIGEGRGTLHGSGIERSHSHLCGHAFARERWEAGGSLAVLYVGLGHGAIEGTERFGTITDDLVEREALRLVQDHVCCRAMHSKDRE